MPLRHTPRQHERRAESRLRHEPRNSPQSRPRVLSCPRTESARDAQAGDPVRGEGVPGVGTATVSYVAGALVSSATSGGAKRYSAPARPTAAVGRPRTHGLRLRRTVANTEAASGVVFTDQRMQKSQGVAVLTFAGLALHPAGCRSPRSPPISVPPTLTCDRWTLRQTERARVSALALDPQGLASLALRDSGARQRSCSLYHPGTPRGENAQPGLSRRPRRRAPPLAPLQTT